MVDVLAVFITLAVEGEERAYSVRLSVPASWKQKPMEALLRAFVKRANSNDSPIKKKTRRAGARTRFGNTTDNINKKLIDAAKALERVFNSGVEILTHEVSQSWAKEVGHVLDATAKVAEVANLLKAKAPEVACLKAALAVKHAMRSEEELGKSVDERIAHAAMPEPVAAVAVAVVNSTLADVANAVPATATAVVRSSVEALVVASRPSSVEDASASDTGSGRRGPVQPHGPL